MLNPTTTKIVSRVSEGVAVDCETAILPVRTLPLVTLTCHEIITAQDASLRAAQQDVYVKALVIAELDGVITALGESIEELTGEHADAVSNVQSLMEIKSQQTDLIEEYATTIVNQQYALKAYEKDMEGTLKALEDSRKASVILLEMADAASKDADKHLDNARDLSQLLDDSGKREDRMHETLMGIRALAESNALTDAEKVALILRLA